MLSLKLNTANRFIGSLLLVSLGVLAALLVLTFKGSAIPAGNTDQKMDIFDTSSDVPSTIVLEGTYPVVTIVTGQETGTMYQVRQAQQPAPILVHLYPYLWQEQPIHLGAEIAAGATVFLGLLYTGMKFIYRNVSKEVFP